MRIGCVKEIKEQEYRVGMTPNCVRSYRAQGHQVYLEAGAGEGAGFTDEEYTGAGAELLSSAKEVFDLSEMIIKVKEPLKQEYELMHEGQILFTYLHLAANEPLVQALLEKKVNAVAYETIVGKNGGLPCLKPMSEIAGRLSVQEGAKYLEKAFGGRGVLLGGVPGVERGRVVIIGGGMVGTNACKMAVGMGADVTVLDNNLDRLEYLDDLFGGRIQTLYSSEEHIHDAVKQADLVIGAVLIPGASAPKLLKREYLKDMKRAAVVVDVAVDQGGCFETTVPTTHTQPTFVVDGVVHYCVANMPGAVPRTSTMALVNATLPYGLKIASMGLKEALQSDAGLKKGLNTYEGKCTLQAVAEEFHLEYQEMI